MRTKLLFIFPILASLPGLSHWQIHPTDGMDAGVPNLESILIGGFVESQHLHQKGVCFSKTMGTKALREGILMDAARATPQVDTKIGKSGPFWTETNLAMAQVTSEAPKNMPLVRPEIRSSDQFFDRDPDGGTWAFGRHYRVSYGIEKALLNLPDPWDRSSLAHAQGAVGQIPVLSTGKPALSNVSQVESSTGTFSNCVACVPLEKNRSGFSHASLLYYFDDGAFFRLDPFSKDSLQAHQLQGDHGFLSMSNKIFLSEAPYQSATSYGNRFVTFFEPNELSFFIYDKQGDVAFNRAPDMETFKDIASPQTYQSIETIFPVDFFRGAVFAKFYVVFRQATDEEYRYDIIRFCKSADGFCAKIIAKDVTYFAFDNIGLQLAFLARDLLYRVRLRDETEPVAIARLRLSARESIKKEKFHLFDDMLVMRIDDGENKRVAVLNLKTGKQEKLQTQASNYSLSVQARHAFLILKQKEEKKKPVLYTWEPKTDQLNLNDSVDGGPAVPDEDLREVFRFDLAGKVVTAFFYRQKRERLSFFSARILDEGTGEETTINTPFKVPRTTFESVGNKVFIRARDGRLLGVFILNKKTRKFATWFREFP